MVIAVNLNLTDQKQALGKSNKTNFYMEFFCLSHLFGRARILDVKIFSQKIEFRGHENILGTHKNTLEITRESEISKRADCIIGVSSTKSCSDLDSTLVDHIKTCGEMAFVICVEDCQFEFSGFGSQDLELSDEKEMVFRKSEFASPRTAAIRCDSAAIDIPRRMIELLQNAQTRGSIEIAAIQRIGPSARELPPIEFE